MKSLRQRIKGSENNPMDSLRNRVAAVFPLGDMDGQPLAVPYMAPAARHLHHRLHPLDMVEKTKGPVKTVMGWVDAIVYALVLVYIIFAFIGQNYKDPFVKPGEIAACRRLSLGEQDYLRASGAADTAAFPAGTAHTPCDKHKSYIENPQLDYHRLPGLRQIKRGDIVVFNYPQGDTVALKIQNPDYYPDLPLTSAGTASTAHGSI